MIDQLDVNHKVGIVRFDIHDDNLVDIDLLTKMADKYPNLYYAEIHDKYNQVKHDVHN